jgi:hypothetical protein
MSYARILSMKIEISVMPARTAGIQARKDAAETSMSTWIPALHAGMTRSGVSLESTKATSSRTFSGGREGHEDRITERASNLKRMFSSFVIFVCSSFVVVCIFVLLAVMPH